MISVNICPDTAVQLIVGVGSCVLALLLMLIKIPQSEYYTKLSNSKSAIVVSFLICSFMMFYAMSQYGSPQIRDWEMLTMLSIYIVVHFSTSIISYSMISLLKTERHKSSNLFAPGLFVSAIVSFLLIESYKSTNTDYFWGTCIIALTAFLIQSITYIIYFDKAYKQALKDLENYYDEDESHKIKWIRFCYVIAMLTNLFVLVYLALYWFLDYKMTVASLYTCWYLIYMLYLTSNFISFLGSHKLVLDAFAYKTLSGQTIRERRSRKNSKESYTESHTPYNEMEFRKLEHSIAKWVEEKRYCEYDKSREETAEDMKTSKEMLHIYFTAHMGIDFRTWRTSLRIEEAKRLLLENKELPIHMVGEMSGFSDRANFHRQFVKATGYSPKQWRDSNGS